MAEPTTDAAASAATTSGSAQAGAGPEQRAADPTTRGETVFVAGTGEIKIVVNRKTMEVSARPSAARIKKKGCETLTWQLFVVANPDAPPERQMIEPVAMTDGSLLVIFPQRSPVDALEVRWPPRDPAGRVLDGDRAGALVDREADYGVYHYATIASIKDRDGLPVIYSDVGCNSVGVGK